MGNSRPSRRKVSRKLAAHDGRTLTVDACCSLEITLSPTRLQVAHDAWCVVLTAPATPAGIAARLKANSAVGQALTDNGYGPVTAVMVP